MTQFDVVKSSLCETSGMTRCRFNFAQRCWEMGDVPRIACNEYRRDWVRVAEHDVGIALRRGVALLSATRPLAYSGRCMDGDVTRATSKSSRES